jgi:hypothetical protein
VSLYIIKNYKTKNLKKKKNIQNFNKYKYKYKKKKKKKNLKKEGWPSHCHDWSGSGRTTPMAFGGGLATLKEQNGGGRNDPKSLGSARTIPTNGSG